MRGDREKSMANLDEAQRRLRQAVETFEKEKSEYYANVARNSLSITETLRTKLQSKSN
jgi:hypothetical protein